MLETLAATDIAGALLANVDFVTEWVGDFSLLPSKNGVLVARLHTNHTFNSKSFDFVRKAKTPTIANVTVSMPLNRFSAFSMIRLGTYRTQAGTDVEITTADLAGPTTITLTLELQFTNKQGNRGTVDISEFEWEHPQVRFYQIPA